MSPEVIIMKKEDKELNKIFSANIKYLISRSGKRQQDVAAELGVPRTTFNNWCVGKVLPSLPKLRALAEYFHVEEDALVRPLVGSSIMFSMQLTSEELDLVEAFRAASSTQRSMALTLLKRAPVTIAALRPEMEMHISPNLDAAEARRTYAESLQRVIDDATASATARVEATSSGISEELRERQRKQAAEFAALKAGKKEGAE